MLIELKELTAGTVHEVANALHDAASDDTVLLKVRDVSAGTGSRGSGRELRTMVENIIDQDHHKVVLDFAGITACSSAFVDELIGKLVQKYGFLAYSQLVSVVHITGVNEHLINHSVVQRLAEPMQKGKIEGGM